MQSIDYASLYDGYWQRPDRFASSSFADASVLARRVMKVCGAGSVLDVGCGFGALVHAMLREGIDARGIDVARVAVEHANGAAPGRFAVGSILDLPHADDSFDTVVCTDCLEHLSPQDVPLALRELARVARRNVFIVVSTVQDRDQQWHLTVQERDWWELAAFTAGEGTKHLLRRHPRALLDVSYEARELEGPSVTLALEKCPLGVLGYSRERLLRTRGLHMDMLREPGRRADAHLARYVLAAGLVRPGDAVLDASCGLGYGSHVLRQCSNAGEVRGLDIANDAIAYCEAAFGSSATFEQGDASRLATIADDSVDFIACFETLEHVEEPAAMLREFARVLTPGGRLVVSVPHDWTDETGKDPNPHHLRVYDWARLRGQLLGREGDGEGHAKADARGEDTEPSLDDVLWIERASAQLAGGGMKHASSHRRIVPLRLTDGDRIHEEDAGQPIEWLLATVVKSPVCKGSACSRAKYRETIFTDARGGVPAGNVASFARDYENPWLVRAMVAMGMRIARPSLLRALAERVLRYAPESSADAGAALCVLLYDALGDGSERAGGDVRALLDRVEKLHDRASGRPHAQRWVISNWFAAGLLEQSLGEVGRALRAFERCAAGDVLAFSPLLATKTIEARFRAGLLRAQGAGDGGGGGEAGLARAREHWQAGLLEARRVFSTGDWCDVWGDERSPLSFAMPEASQVMDVAGRCAAALRAGELWRTAPALAYELTTHTPAQHARATRAELEQRASDSGRVLGGLHAEIRALAGSRDTWLREAKRLEGEWKKLSWLPEAHASAVARAREYGEAIAQLHAEQRASKERAHEQGQQLARALQLLEKANAKVERVFAEAQGLQRERDTWLTEAQRLEREWRSVGEQAQRIASEHRSHVEAARVQILALGDELASVRAAHEARERDASGQIASLRAQLDEIRRQVRDLQQRRAFRALRSLHLLSPISMDVKPGGLSNGVSERGGSHGPPASPG